MQKIKVALLYPGVATAGQFIALEVSPRFRDIAEALISKGAEVIPCHYQDEWAEDLKHTLITQQVSVVLVWVNPIENGRNRQVLDAMLLALAAAGMKISTHPDIIMKLGTKQVLYDTRHLSCGSDVAVHDNSASLRLALSQLTHARVLKQLRGHSGIGIWKVAPHPSGLVAQHAERGARAEILSVDEFLARCGAYFEGNGRMIDQAFQARIDEGMWRCYLVRGQVAGFGHQEVVALHSKKAPEARLYYPADTPKWQALKQRCEEEWVPALCALYGLATHDLPVLWDMDFMLGDAGQYVLCEINVSSVSPYPPSVVSLLVDAVLAQ